MDDLKQGGEELHHEAEKPQSLSAAREEAILQFWNTEKIFEKSLEKPAPKGEFVFYDGPPFATGLPHFGHLLQSTIKDAVPRYRTMQGYRVPRVWGWDCHGLPLENQIEQELGFKTKRDIEQFGVEKFNDAARSAVLRYAEDWKRIIPRIGRWADMDNDYRTMDASYSESVWWAFKNLYDRGLIYEGFKAMHFCPRCGTTLSNNEVGLGYKDIDDLAVYVKLPLIDEPNTSLLIWTTTAWTLPGNSAAGVNAEATYVKVKVGGEILIVAKERNTLDGEIVAEIKGKELVGKKYEPPFDYFKGEIHKHKTHAFKVYAAPYVTLESGTGIVHLAPAFGAEDLELAQKEKIPLIHHVTDEGKFIATVKDFAGLLVKPKGNPRETDEKVAALIEERGKLFKKEKIKHSYPHCWRCDTPLLNWAANSWFVKVSALKSKLIAENKKVSWVPNHVGTGRFNNLLESAPDWAISRSRYWGAPLPVWRHTKTKEIKVAGSVGELLKLVRKSGNTYFVMRHGEANSNVNNVLDSYGDPANHLSEQGKTDVALSAAGIQGKGIDLIIHSPLLRTRETAAIVQKTLGLPDSSVMVDERLRETGLGIYSGKSLDEWHAFYGSVAERFLHAPEKGESFADVQRRIGEFMFDIERRYVRKKILIISHGNPLWILTNLANRVSPRTLPKEDLPQRAEIKEVEFVPYPHNKEYELDLHRPYIDNVPLGDSINGEWRRVPDVFDCWFESGSMPYASHAYPQNKTEFDPKRLFGFGSKGYPAHFIAEAIDQTRGWFYSLIVLGVGLFGRTPYRAVVTTGLILAEDGRKMSKKLKNYPDPVGLIEKYGADALRYYMLSSPAIRGEDLRFSERGVDEVSKKIVMRLDNVCSFYELYAEKKDPSRSPSTEDSVGVRVQHLSSPLDRWILSRLGQLVEESTDGYEKYELDNATRPLASFIDDLSTWYVRRSRDRFKEEGEDKQQALVILRHVLFTIAHVMAPVMPFFAENLYQRVKEEGDAQSVHLCDWPEAPVIDEALLKDMREIRSLASQGLEQREKSGLKVRQPLAALAAKNIPADPQLRDILRDEVNIKEVREDVTLESVWLDTNLTDALKEEGVLRDIMRTIQAQRKDQKLQMSDRPDFTLTLSPEQAAVAKKYLDKIIVDTGLNSLKIEVQ